MGRTEQAQGLRLMKFEEVHERTTTRLLRQSEAAEVLGMSERIFRRWRNRYEADGAEGLYDRRLGRVSARCAPVGRHAPEVRRPPYERFRSGLDERVDPVGDALGRFGTKAFRNHQLSHLLLDSSHLLLSM